MLFPRSYGINRTRGVKFFKRNFHRKFLRILRAKKAFFYSPFEDLIEFSGLSLYFFNVSAESRFAVQLRNVAKITTERSLKVDFIKLSIFENYASLRLLHFAFLPKKNDRKFVIFCLFVFPRFFYRLDEFHVDP